jgi:hypothetical protein
MDCSQGLLPLCNQVIEMLKADGKMQRGCRRLDLDKLFGFKLRGRDRGRMWGQRSDAA